MVTQALRRPNRLISTPFFAHRALGCTSTASGRSPHERGCKSCRVDETRSLQGVATRNRHGANHVLASTATPPFQEVES
jgi:hypothetical protein